MSGDDAITVQIPVPEGVVLVDGIDAATGPLPRYIWNECVAHAVAGRVMRLSVVGAVDGAVRRCRDTWLSQNEVRGVDVIAKVLRCLDGLCLEWVVRRVLGHSGRDNGRR